MKLGKVLGVSLGILGGACLVAWVNNSIREEKMQKELWESYSKDYRIKTDTISVDTAAAKKAYFEASQLINDSIKTTIKTIK